MRKRFRQHELSDKVFVFDDGYRGACTFEDTDLIAYWMWMQHKFPSVLWFHTPNETKKPTPQYLESRRRKGVLDGVSDIVILTPGVNWHKAIIEAKRRDSSLSKWQKGQIPFLNKGADDGAFAAVACGLEQLKKATLFYFGLPFDVD